MSRAVMDEWVERSIDLHQLGDTHLERQECFAQLLHACRVSVGSVQMPSDAVDAEFLFRWESPAVRIDCLTDPTAHAPLLEPDAFVPPAGAFYTVTAVLVDSKDARTMEAVDAWLAGINVVSPPAILPPLAWCIDAYERSLVGTRAGAELDLLLTEADLSSTNWQSFTYGECGFTEVSNLFCVLEQHCGITPEGLAFVDLGHGVGNVVLAAALLRKWGTVMGIELCGQRFAESLRLLTRWQNEVAPTLPLEQQQLNVAITLEHGDFLRVQTFSGNPTWSCADVVFVHATCFDRVMLENLTALTGSLRAGSVILSVGKALVSDHLQPMFAWGCTMSYSKGMATPVYIQRRRETEY